MTTDFKSIPIIDVSPLLAKCDDPKMGEDPGVAQVVRLLDQACREAGFFYVKGHGIPESLIKDVRTLSHQFFELSYEEKLKIKMTPAAGYRPDTPVDLKHKMEEYVGLCTDLSKKIMRGIALALGGSPYEFEGERAGDPFWVLRVIGYPGASKENGHDSKENDVGCGAHTDYGLLTLVNQDDSITALQVRNLSGEWISAVPVPGTFVCNIGDMLKIWSNGLFESTLHRVVNNSPVYRVCVAYFYEPNFDVGVEPLDFCVKRTGGSQKFGRAVYGEHLVGKVQTNFVS